MYLMLLYTNSNMATFYILCAVFLCTTQAQAFSLLNPPCQPVIPPCPQVPIVPPCPQVVPPCPQLVSPCQTQVTTTSPVVATTIVDNSVSNALANALQLLIVSNLIENTMNQPCCNSLQTVTPICDPITIQAPMYSPIVDVITPDYYPYVYDPIITPCDYIKPCDPVMEILPTYVGYPEVYSCPNVGCGCGYGNPFIPNVDCGYDNPFIPNVGCGYDNPFIPNVGCGYDNPFIPNIGCGCGNVGNCGCGNIGNCGCGNIGNCGCGCLPTLQSLLPSLLPNVGCGCNNFGYDLNPYSPCACDPCSPIIPEVVYPAKVSYGYPTNYPVGVSVDPFCYDPCPNNCYGNPYYY